MSLFVDPDDRELQDNMEASSESESSESQSTVREKRANDSSDETETEVSEEDYDSHGSMEYFQHVLRRASMPSEEYDDYDSHGTSERPSFTTNHRVPPASSDSDDDSRGGSAANRVERRLLPYFAHQNNEVAQRVDTANTLKNKLLAIFHLVMIVDMLIRIYMNLAELSKNFCK